MRDNEARNKLGQEQAGNRGVLWAQPPGCRVGGWAGGTGVGLHPRGSGLAEPGKVLGNWNSNWILENGYIFLFIFFCFVSNPIHI